MGIVARYDGCGTNIGVVVMMPPIVYCMQCILCSVLYAVYPMECIVCSVLYAVYCMQCIVCSVLYGVYIYRVMKIVHIRAGSMHQ